MSSPIGADVPVCVCLSVTPRFGDKNRDAIEPVQLDDNLRRGGGDVDGRVGTVDGWTVDSWAVGSLAVDRW